MSLFPPASDLNILPKDGSAFYFGSILPHADAHRIFQDLMTQIPWEPDSVRLFGKQITTSRKVAWIADDALSYTYSGVTKHAHPWSPLLASIRRLVEKLTGEQFNSCLLNLYHDGSEGMSWHSDDENSLLPHSAIASLSLGAERKFCFKHKREALSLGLSLEHGSLLLMQGATQTNWLHSLPKSKRIHSPRINLTFRKMKSSSVSGLRQTTNKT